MKESTSNSPSTAKTNGKWQSKDLQNLSSEADSSLSGVQQQVMTTAKDAYNKVVEGASSAYDVVNTRGFGFVRQYPLQAALGGLAIGFLLGAAISRRPQIYTK